MAYGSPRWRGEVLEHGRPGPDAGFASGGSGIALWIAVVEGVLVVVDVIPWPVALVVAVAVVVFYFSCGAPASTRIRPAR